MPKSYVECVSTLATAGVGKGQAQRACSIAFWQEHGLTPAQADATGVDPDGDLADTAQSLVAVLSSTERPVVHLSMTEATPMRPVESWNPADYPPDPELGEKCPRMLREARLLRVGTFEAMTGKVEVTEARIRKIAAAFDPLEEIPIQVDHVMSAWYTVGRLRAVKVLGTGDDTELWGLEEIIGRKACRKVASKLWTRQSVGILNDKLDEVSFIVWGAVDGPRPARIYAGKSPEKKEKPTMAGINIASGLKEKRGDLSAQELASKSGLTEARLKEIESGKDATTEEVAKLATAIGCTAEQLGKPADPAPKPELPAPPTTPAELKLDLTKMDPETRAAVEKLQADAQQKDQRLQKLEAKTRVQEDTATVSAWLSKGWVPPATVEGEVAFLGMLDDTQRQAYHKLKELSGPVIRLGKSGKVVDGTAPPPGTLGLGGAATETKERTESFLANAGAKRDSNGKIAFA